QEAGGDIRIFVPDERQPFQPYVAVSHVEQLARCVQDRSLHASHPDDRKTAKIVEIWSFGAVDPGCQVDRVGVALRYRVAVARRSDPALGVRASVAVVELLDLLDSAINGLKVSVSIWVHCE